MLAVATICPQTPSKVHHNYNSPIVRHLVQPLVATYRAHVVRYKINLSKKPYTQDEF
jgi:hypothetical protein